MKKLHFKYSFGQRLHKAGSFQGSCRFTVKSENMSTIPGLLYDAGTSRCWDPLPGIRRGQMSLYSRLLEICSSSVLTVFFHSVFMVLKRTYCRIVNSAWNT